MWDLSWVTTTLLGAVELSYPDVERWSRPLFEAFVAGAWLLHWTDDTLYWVAKPRVHRDPVPDVRRLHRADGPALESDVEPLYFWHGVLVNAHVIEQPDLITLQEIQGETNAEVRRVLLERFGFDRYLRESNAELLHTDQFGELYRAEVPGDEPLVMVSVLNSTPEPDGHKKRYFLRVDPNCRPLLADGTFGRAQALTARNAIASTFGLRGSQYVPVVET